MKTPKKTPQPKATKSKSPNAVPSDIEIARSVKMKPISEIAKKVGIPEKALELYGPYKAKLPLDWVAKGTRKPGKLVLVSAITPTPAGEGKTTTSVGLGQALARLGHKTAIALREPSLGPCMGMKGGAAGGGWSQVLPMEDINLHFTGDLHAVSAAHNLLAAMVDNHIFQGNALGIDPRRVLWGRVVDMNDRSLRHIVIGLGGAMEGVPREAGYDITVASEVMAVLCLSLSIADLKERLGGMLVGFTYDKKPVYARDLKAQGAMAALLKDAIKPNLVQTIEGVPAFIHGGPFANIAHGANSLIATKTALGLADWVVTEAGFGFDLGAEKFFNITSRVGGLSPCCAVIVATTRALKLHGGAPLAEVKEKNMKALEAGMDNLAKHIENGQKFNIPLVVALNRFTFDDEKELDFLRHWCEARNVRFALSEVWEKGGAGGEAVAREVVALGSNGGKPYKPLYDWNAPVEEKIGIIAREIYGAAGVEFQTKAKSDLAAIKSLGLTGLPICMAKTQNSLSDDPKGIGRPRGFTLNVREIKIAAGAGFLIPITGQILRMPGLPKTPAAEAIDIDDEGRISGLF